MYHTNYGSDGTKIRFSINSNGKSDFAPLGRQSTKSLECIRNSIKKKSIFNERKCENRV